MTTLEENPIAVMPHSPSAEECLLGSLLLDPELFRRLNIEPEDFYIQRNAWVYSAIAELIRSGTEPDYITVCTKLDAQKRLNEIGGPARVAELISATPSTLNAEGYAQIIKERAYRRSIIHTAQRLATEAFDMSSNLNGAVSSALDVLARSVITDRGAVHISQYTARILDEVEQAMANPKDVYGIPTGFADWDKVTFGLQRGEKMVISGEPGVGKSILAMQVLMNAAAAGYPGALYELEMSGEQVTRRGLSGMSKVTTQRMRQGKITEAEADAFMAAVDQMSKLPIYMSAATGITTGELRADLIRLKEYFGVQLVVIDYEGLLCDAPDKQFTERSTIISARVHDIAKDLGLAVIAISDMNKAGINGETKGQGAVAGTARVLHDADQITILRQTDLPTVVRMTWEKMREGDGNRFIDLVRIKGYPMFGDKAK